MHTEKEITSSGSLIRQLLLSPRLQHFFSQAFCLGSILSLSVYAWVRLLFHDFPFEIVEETTVILRALFAGWILAACCIGSLKIILFAADNHTQIIRKCAACFIVCCSCLKKLTVVQNENNKRPAGHISIELPEMTMRF